MISHEDEIARGSQPPLQPAGWQLETNGWQNDYGVMIGSGRPPPRLGLGEGGRMILAYTVKNE
jgi:hypothetical protein